LSIFKDFFSLKYQKILKNINLKFKLKLKYYIHNIKIIYRSL
jgi:hypothetical protein